MFSNKNAEFETLHFFNKYFNSEIKSFFVSVHYEKRKVHILLISIQHFF